MSAGTADDARKSIHNMGEMETIKKFTYGLKKTKFMVVDSARGVPEVIKENVKSGQVTEAKEYKYVGFWVNRKGNCELQIDKKKGKIKGEVAALKSVANTYNLGETFVNVRLELYESSIVPSLLFNMEDWNKQTKGEIKKLEQIQAATLCSLLELPKTTPYIGLLNELGMWRIEERMIYRKLMRYNNYINSDDSRLAKRLLEQQEADNDLDESFYGTVLDMTKTIDITIDDLKTLPKNQLKALIKRKLNERMVNVVKNTIPKMSKLRFLSCEEGCELKRKPYITNLKGNDTIEALRIMLNMEVVYGNYRGDITLTRLCPHCDECDDTTEHLVDCRVFHSMVTSNDLKKKDGFNSETWKQILELVTFNMKNRTTDCPTWARNSTQRQSQR